MALSICGNVLICFTLFLGVNVISSPCKEGIPNIIFFPLCKRKVQKNIPMSFLETQSSSEGGIALYFSTPSLVSHLNQSLKALNSCSGEMSYKTDLYN